MNALNYIIEANICLALFLVAYLLVLRNETDFKINRLFLLSGILVSLLFPLFHFQYSVATIPALGNLLPSSVLPEIVITDGNVESTTPESATHDLWFYFELAYVIGITFFLIRFIVQLFDLVLTMKRSKVNALGKLKIVESVEDKPTFSFFNFIFLNQSQSLASHEKEKIILHETIHAKQFHSFDILVLNVINIFFWFNPLIRSYKNIFVQLHEFEADARAVENSDVNEYCSLLAKAALQSADYKLASHFNNSLTLKRIQMIKTIKRKIRPWKMLVIAGVIPVAFFVIACQDQLTKEVAEIAQASTMVADIPADVQMKYDQLLKANPDKSFLLMETDENMTPTLEETKKKYESLHQAQINRIELITPTAKENEGLRTFVIIEYDEDLERAISQSKLSEKIFSMVEDTATPEGGIGAFYEHVGRKLKYPAQARRMGIEGKVFVQFVVTEDGSITDARIVKGIGGGCDKEALMVVQTSAVKWNPGKIKGVAVNQYMVLPISFKLDKGKPTISKDVTIAPKNSLSEVVAVGYSK